MRKCNRSLELKTFLSITIVIFVFLIPGSFLFATGNELTEEKSRKVSSLPHCGLYCVYTLVKAWDGNIEFRDLLKPNYISSYEGSNLSELKQAATDNALFAECIGGMTVQSLKSCSVPVILHVKSNPENLKYDHYWLYTGTKDGKACIFDPPNRIESIPYRELAPRWDGNGLIVSAKPINLANVLAPARKRFVLFAAAVIAAIVSVRIAGRYLSRRVGTVSKPIRLTFSIAQSAGLVIIALFVGVVYHFANDEGFLAHAGATEPVARASIGHFIPKVSAKDVENIDNGAVIIDARQSADYEAGHIDGAINIPTTLCAAGRSEKLADVKKDSRLVIYCQSAGCPYAQIVAANLMDDGFHNIAIYKGGWVDWSKKKER